jgi:CHASE3 domain sensor protein
VTEREQRLFDLGNNFPGLLSDQELKEWSRLRDQLETQPTDQQQYQWSVITVLFAVLLSVVALFIA